MIFLLISKKMRKKTYELFTKTSKFYLKMLKKEEFALKGLNKTLK